MRAVPSDGAGLRGACRRQSFDDNPATAARFQILAIPAFVVVEGGQETMRIAGAKPKGRFAAELGLGVPA